MVGLMTVALCPGRIRNTPPPELVHVPPDTTMLLNSSVIELAPTEAITPLLTTSPPLSPVNTSRPPLLERIVPLLTKRLDPWLLGSTYIPPPGNATVEVLASIRPLLIACRFL